MTIILVLTSSCLKNQNSYDNKQLVSFSKALTGSSKFFQNEKRVKHVLFIGIDGLGSHNLFPETSIKIPNAPNIKSLLNNSFYSLKAKIDTMNISGPNWYGILSSTPSWIHGVLDNECNKGNRIPTIFDYLNKIAIESNFSINTSIISDWDMLFCYPLNPSLIDDRIPTLNTDDTYINTITYLDSGIINLNDYSFTFIYFGNLDNNGHRFGGNSKEYNDELEKIDDKIGQIIQIFKDKGFYDNGAIFITSDHGHKTDNFGHSPSSTYVPFIVQSKILKPINIDLVESNEKFEIRNNFLASFVSKIMGLDPFFHWHEQIPWLE